MHRPLCARLGLALLAASLSATFAYAQFSSSVQGTVTDSSGAVVPDAAVTLTNKGTNTAVETRTQSNGQYRFVTLGAGNYVVRVSRQGFSVSDTAVTVTADEIAGVNVMLHVAASESVQINEQAPILNPEETRTQYTLSEQEFRNLPNQNSATLGLVRLAPGTTGVVENQNNLTENRSLPEANANGRDSASNLYTLDDVPITSSQSYASAFNGNVGGQIVFVPNLSSLGNVALQTTTFAVSYGSAASQIVAFNTKSGANRFHGIFDESYGDRVLQAYGYNVSHTGAAHRHVFSFGVGGPIIRNHTFFWGSYERRNDLEPAGSGSGQYFTPQFAALITNPANDPNQISVTNFIKNNPNTRARFIPSAFDQTASSYFGVCNNGVSSYNVPCSTLVTENAIEAGQHFLDGKNYSIRVDQVLRGGKDRLYGYYFGMDQNSDSESIAPGFDGYTPTDGKDFSANYTHQFTPRIVNQATFGYWNFRFNFTTTPHSRTLVQLPFLFLNLGVGNFTRFVPFSDKESQFYGRDTVLWAKGKHNFNIGVEVANNISNDDRTGIYTRPFIYLWFSKQDFFDDKQDLLIVDNYYSGTTGKHIGSISAASNLRYGVYFQDSWKLRPNLTVNYGVRYDDLGSPQPYSNTIPFANVTNRFPDGILHDQALVQSLQVAAVKRAYDSQNNNVDPRIGIAWAPARDNYSTVVRGGFGLYQDLPNLQNVSGQVTSNPPGIIGYTGCCNGTVGYGTNQDAAQGFGFTNIPLSIAAPVYRADGSVVGTSANIAGVSSRLKPQRALIYDFSLEHQFRGNLVTALTYTGSHGYQLVYSADLNRPNGSATQIDPVKNKEVYTPPNTNFGGVVPYLNGEISNANELTAAIRQNLNGYVWQASYNWGHIQGETNGFNSGAGNNTIIDSYNPQFQYGDAPFDIRNSFKLSGLFPLKVHFSNAPLQQTLGGWSLNSVVIAQTGQPFEIYYQNQQAITDFAANNKGGQKPDYTGTRRSWSRKEWKQGIFPYLFDDPTLNNSPCAAQHLPSPCYGGFTRPAGAVSNQGSYTFRNASYFTLDSTVQKAISLPWFEDRSTLTLRVDGFNLLNRFNPYPIQQNDLGNPGGQAIDGGTGPVTTGARQARVLQLGARFEF